MGAAGARTAPGERRRSSGQREVRRYSGDAGGTWNEVPEHHSRSYPHSPPPLGERTTPRTPSRSGLLSRGAKPPLATLQPSRWDGKTNTRTIHWHDFQNHCSPAFPPFLPFLRSLRYLYVSGSSSARRPIAPLWAGERGCGRPCDRSILGLVDRSEAGSRFGPLSGSPEQSHGPLPQGTPASQERALTWLFPLPSSASMSPRTTLTSPSAWTPLPPALTTRPRAIAPWRACWSRPHPSACAGSHRRIRAAGPPPSR